MRFVTAASDENSSSNRFPSFARLVFRAVQACGIPAIQRRRAIRANGPPSRAASRHGRARARGQRRATAAPAPARGRSSAARASASVTSRRPSSSQSRSIAARAVHARIGSGQIGGTQQRGSGPGRTAATRRARSSRARQRSTESSPAICPAIFRKAERADACRQDRRRAKDVLGERDDFLAPRCEILDDDADARTAVRR